jgi:hypothetical protein
VRAAENELDAVSPVALLQLKGLVGALDPVDEILASRRLRHLKLPSLF